MLPVILGKRKSKVSTQQAFNKLIVYVEGGTELDKLSAISNDQKFENILNYATNNQDIHFRQEKCIAIRTHGVTDIASAALEMNAVSARNTRCKDPAFHFVLTWPEHERPQPNKIFDAAEHAIQSLGLAEHQYVLAVHVNTDNIHCHGAINRIHPDTYKSKNIEWAKKTLHLAARQSEIKHGWTNENGIYTVMIDEHNQKIITLNPFHDPSMRCFLQDDEQVVALPTWHDPDSLDSYLKSTVARELKHTLPRLGSWQALHSWLDRYGITLDDTGGGGMRLHATSPETGEILDLPVSRGLRILKHAELEARWGKFVNITFAPCTVPDLSHLTSQQIAKGVEHVITSAFDNGIPPNHIIRANEIRHRQATETDTKPEVEKIVTRRSLILDNSNRAVRREQRAAARADLRHRFSKYQSFVREGDVDYLKRTKEIRSERSQSLKVIREEAKAAILTIRKISPVNLEMRLYKAVEIEFERSSRKLRTEARFQEKTQSLRAMRLPPLGWREWLYEQSNLGDQAALSALRGIVYQAQRDAKNGNDNTEDFVEEEADTKEYRERQYRKVMSRLLAEEKKEVAIRSTRSNAMRPYEVDALLVRYISMQWHVTGNGNIAYSDQDGRHLFTDRGNRVTFDRVRVTDEEIRLALAHAQLKFGKYLTLTGEDSVFSARMARLADDFGIVILNPELQTVIVKHRNDRMPQISVEQLTMPDPSIPTLPKEADSPSNDLVKLDSLTQESIRASTEKPPIEEPSLLTSQERLRAMVLAIDPRAEFVIPDISDSHKIHIGPVVAALTTEDHGHGFAQHIARSVYALHLATPPEHHNNANFEIQYRNGLAVASVTGVAKGKTR
jgi:hypothetical protein